MQEAQQAAQTPLPIRSLDAPASMQAPSSRAKSQSEAISKFKTAVSSVQILQRVSTAFTSVNDKEAVGGSETRKATPTNDILTGTLIAKAASFRRASTRVSVRTPSLNDDTNSDLLTSTPGFDELIKELTEKSELLELSATMGNRLVEELTAAHAIIDMLELEKQDITAILGEATTKISLLDYRLAEFEDSSAQQDELEQLSEQKATLIMQLHSLRETLQQERLVSQQQATRIDQLESEVVDLLTVHDAEIKALQQELQAATAGRAQANRERDQARARVTNLQQEVENLQAASLTDVPSTPASEVAQSPRGNMLNPEPQSAEDDMDKQSLISHCEFLKQFEVKYEDVCGQLVECTHRHSQLQHRYQTLETRNNNLELSCSLMAGEKQAAEQRLATAEQDRHTHMAACSGQIQSLQQQLETVESALKAKENSLVLVEQELRAFRVPKTNTHRQADWIGQGIRLTRGVLVISIAVVSATRLTRYAARTPLF